MKNRSQSEDRRFGRQREMHFKGQKPGVKIFYHNILSSKRFAVIWKCRYLEKNFVNNLGLKPSQSCFCRYLEGNSVPNGLLTLSVDLKKILFSAIILLISYIYWFIVYGYLNTILIHQFFTCIAIFRNQIFLISWFFQVLKNVFYFY